MPAYENTCDLKSSVRYCKVTEKTDKENKPNYSDDSGRWDFILRESDYTNCALE